MGALASRQNAGVEEADVVSNHAYKYPPRSGNYFGSHFIMGGERFDTPQPEAYLFGENADLNFLGSRPTPFPYPPPQSNEPTKTLKSLVNIRKESLRFVRCPEPVGKLVENNKIGDGMIKPVENGKGTYYNIEFTFDCDARIAITIFYFCTEEVTPTGVVYYPRDPAMTSQTYHYKKGANQQFCQLAHVFDPSRHADEELLYNADTEIIPVAIYCVVDEGQDEIRQSHTTIAVVEKHSDGTYVLKALKQKLFVDGLCYLLQEIYGIENKNLDTKPTSDEETEEGGSECVICMCDVRDTLILPCRHLCLCNSCADSLRYQANNCPICRAPFRALLQIRALQRATAPPPPASPPLGSMENIPAGYEPVSLIEALNGPHPARAPPALAPAIASPDTDTASQVLVHSTDHIPPLHKHLVSLIQALAPPALAPAIASPDTDTASQVLVHSTDHIPPLHKHLVSLIQALAPPALAPAIASPDTDTASQVLVHSTDHIPPLHKHLVSLIQALAPPALAPAIASPDTDTASQVLVHSTDHIPPLHKHLVSLIQALAPPALAPAIASPDTDTASQVLVHSTDHIPPLHKHLVSLIQALAPPALAPAIASPDTDTASQVLVHSTDHIPPLHKHLVSLIQALAPPALAPAIASPDTDTASQVLVHSTDHIPPLHKHLVSLIQALAPPALAPAIASPDTDTASQVLVHSTDHIPPLHKHLVSLIQALAPPALAPAIASPDTDTASQVLVHSTDHIPPLHKHLVSLIQALAPPALAPAIASPDTDTASQAAEILNRCNLERSSSTSLGSALNNTHALTPEFRMSVLLAREQDGRRERAASPLLREPARVSPEAVNKSSLSLEYPAEASVHEPSSEDEGSAELALAEPEPAEEHEPDSDAERLSPLLTQPQAPLQPNGVGHLGGRARARSPLPPRAHIDDPDPDVPASPRACEVNRVGKSWLLVKAASSAGSAGSPPAEDSDYFTPEDTATTILTVPKHKHAEPMSNGPVAGDGTPQRWALPHRVTSLPGTPLSQSSVRSSGDSYSSTSSTRQLLAAAPLPADTAC
ncbi:uncharacterized protein LOC133520982 [Cydia pomonella]|uniref:uncharacterized protein LOC133520982 n=1 Tax=Cydia pomonella TaxID=82600 RepID=UPI002ADD8F0A|nr:uncharacterized protein LOC133520982 [Cydia pomonella]